MTRRCLTNAFTLVELLVVIAIIAVLASMMLPGLAGAKERARRSECVSNSRQFAMACQIYAADNDNFLPKAGTDNRLTGDTHTPVLGTPTATNMLRYMQGPRVLDCPNIHGWMQRTNWRKQTDYGMAIGYHYLGGHPNSPWDPPPGTTNRWISPQTTTEAPTLPLVADLNVYCHAILKVLSPHGPSGPIMRDEKYYIANLKGPMVETCVDAGARGGNVALLDGSVSWKPIRKMKNYKASNLWDTSGAYGFW